MAFVVETGAGVEDANSYATEAAFDAYCEDHGLTAADGDTEPALVRATVWLDAYTLPRLMGLRTHGRSQALAWPRINVLDREGYVIQPDEIPQQIIDACCEAAIREKANPGALSPDVTTAEKVKRLKAGSVEIEYAGSTGGPGDLRPIVSVVDDILASLLGPRPSPYFGRAIRA
jgi:hypothetical protein